MQTHLIVNFPSLVIRVLFSSGRGWEATSSMGNVGPAFKQIRGAGRDLFLQLLIFQFPSTQSNPCAKVAYLGAVYSGPLQYPLGMQMLTLRVIQKTSRMKGKKK